MASLFSGCIWGEQRGGTGLGELVQHEEENIGARPPSRT